MQPSQFSTPQLQQPRYKSPTAFTPAAQPQQVQPASVDRVQPITQPISYDVTGQAGQIQLPTGGASSFVPDVRQYINEAGNVLFIPFVNGQPLYSIPEGYKPKEEQEEQQQQQQQQQQATQERTEDLFVSDSEGDGGGDGDDGPGYSAADDPDSYGIGMLGNAGFTGFAPGLTSALGYDSALSEEAAGLLGVAGALGVPGTGIIGGIGATVNQADVAMSLGEVYGIEVDHLDALSIGFLGMENSKKGKEIMDAIIDDPAPMIGRQMDAAVTSGQISQEDADALSAAGIAFDNAKGFVDNMGMTYGEVAAQVEAEKDVSLDAFGGTGAPVGGGPSGSGVGGTPGGLGAAGGYGDFGGMEGDEGPDSGDGEGGGHSGVDSGDSAGMGGEDVNKGGFINKKHMGKKTKKENKKGLAARRISK